MGKSRLDLSALDLKLLAMAAMLVDHMGYLLFPTVMWMRYVGRLAFPIFAFQIAEGWYRTHDREKYTLRLLICAVVSEVPFDLAFSGTPVDAGYQNVLWTFFIAAAALWAADALQERLRLPLPLAALPAAGAGYLLLPSASMTVWGMELPVQLLAAAALPLIWLYRGRQGPHSPVLQGIWYAFYPAHLLLLWWLARSIGI